MIQPKPRFVAFGAMVAAALGLIASTVVPNVQAQATGCQFLTGGGPAAFCDTFDAPSVNPGRAGQLAPIWGASRVTGNANLNQGYDNAWADTEIMLCDGSHPVVHPPNDIQICNGQVREAVNDSGMDDLAMYPRQPFDIAGRTGTVVFDVSNDSAGSHTSWPEFSFTDQPIPAPSPNQVAFPGVLVARNSFNLEFSGMRDNCVTVDFAWVTVNYASSLINVVTDNCIMQPAHGSFALNHMEIHMSQTGWEVWGSDAGTKVMKKIAHGSVNMPLTRGLVWMKDVHYAGNKPCHEGVQVQCQQQHTYAWDNFGFDGPTLPRDLGIELPDHLNIVDGFPPDNGLPTRDLGQTFNSSINKTHAMLNFSGPYALSNVAGASAALLELNYYTQDRVTFVYAVNGKSAHTFPMPSNVATWFQQTIALPIPVSELYDGANTIDFSVSHSGPLFGFSNVDLILVGAGGGGSGQPPTSTPVPPTATSVPSTPVPSPTPGQQFTQNLNKGDTDTVNCPNGTLQLLSSSPTQVVLKCS